jgi:hypothetical protein
VSGSCDRSVLIHDIIAHQSVCSVHVSVSVMDQVFTSTPLARFACSQKSSATMQLKQLTELSLQERIEPGVETPLMPLRHWRETSASSLPSDSPGTSELPFTRSVSVGWAVQRERSAAAARHPHREGAHARLVPARPESSNVWRHRLPGCM